MRVYRTPSSGASDPVQRIRVTRGTRVDGRHAEPGEEFDVPERVAIMLVNSGKAVPVGQGEPAIDTRDPVATKPKARAKTVAKKRTSKK